MIFFPIFKSKNTVWSEGSLRKAEAKNFTLYKNLSDETSKTHLLIRILLKNCSSGSNPYYIEYYQQKEPKI